MEKWLSPITFSVLLLVTLGAQNVLAATVTLNEDATMTVGSDATLTINTDDSSTLANQGTVNVEENGIINVGSEASSLTLLSNDGTINGPGVINLFGIDIEVLNTGVITAIINEFLTESPVIGGETIPIDTTALLLSSAQTSMIWWLPAVLIIGASIVLIKTRKSVKVNE